MTESISLDFKDWRDAQAIIAQGCLTNSKSPRSHIYGVYPTHVKNGDRCYLFGHDDTRYTDYICGLGANLVGYNNTTINQAITDAIRGGISHSLPTDWEIRAAQAIQSVVPWINRVKFLKTGSGACDASLIIARAFTKRRKVLTSGYHGWGQEWTSLTPPAHGCLKYDDIEHFSDPEQIDTNTAAVIVEPIMLEDSIANRRWLKDIRARCNDTGAVLIFDEIITGFRVPKLTVSEYYKVRPDLLLLGKAMAGGAPLSAVCGHADIMDEPYFVSSTFAGEVIGLAACIANINLLTRKPDYHVDNVWKMGGHFMDEFNKIWPDGVRLEGYQTRGRFVGGELTRALFFQEAIKSGLLFGPSWFYTIHHEAERKTTLDICNDILMRIKRGGVQLEGEMPQSPFAMKVRDHDRH